MTEEENGSFRSSEEETEAQQFNEEEFEHDANNRVENIGEYEREKLERTLGDAKHLVAVITNYLEMVKYADENGIRLPHKPELEKIRYPGNIFDPAKKDGLVAMSVVFENAMSEISKDIHYSHEPEITKRMQK